MGNKCRCRSGFDRAKASHKCSDLPPQFSYFRPTAGRVNNSHREGNSLLQHFSASLTPKRIFTFDKFSLAARSNLVRTFPIPYLFLRERSRMCVLFLTLSLPIFWKPNDGERRPVLDAQLLDVTPYHPSPRHRSQTPHQIRPIRLLPSRCRHHPRSRDSRTLHTRERRP